MHLYISVFTQSAHIPPCVGFKGASYPAPSFPHLGLLWELASVSPHTVPEHWCSLDICQAVVVGTPA